MPDIMAKIREHGNESTKKRLRVSTYGLSKKEMAKRLRDYLDDRVAAGELHVRTEKAGNGKLVAYYSIPGAEIIKTSDCFGDYEDDDDDEEES